MGKFGAGGGRSEYQGGTCSPIREQMGERQWGGRRTRGKRALIGHWRGLQTGERLYGGKVGLGGWYLVPYQYYYRAFVTGCHGPLQQCLNKDHVGAPLLGTC